MALIKIKTHVKLSIKSILFYKTLNLLVIANVTAKSETQS